MRVYELQPFILLRSTVPSLEYPEASRLPLPATEDLIEMTWNLGSCVARCHEAGNAHQLE